MSAPRNLLGRSVVALAAALVLAACGDDAPPASSPTPTPRPKAAPTDTAGQPPAEAATDAVYVYTYNPVGKRDPFRSPLDVANQRNTGPRKPDEAAPCTDVLCQYALDELHLVAVVSGDANPTAMVEDPSGVGHIVRRNTKVGKAGGKVTQVLRDCIVVTSFVQTSDGKAQPVKNNMCVSRDQRATPVLDLLQGKLRE